MASEELVPLFFLSTWKVLKACSFEVLVFFVAMKPYFLGDFRTLVTFGNLGKFLLF